MTDGQSHKPTRRRFLGGVVATAVAAGTAGVASGEAEAASGGAITRGGGALSATAQEGRMGEALRIRHEAAALAMAIEPATHVANGDERVDMAYAMSFTKGLAHDHESGLVRRPADFERFVAAIDTGARDDFRAVPLGPHDGFRTAPDDAPLRGWETPAAGLCFNLVGYDPQSLTMPPAPRAGSAELIGELAELYALAVLRDEPLGALRHDAPTSPSQNAMIEGLQGFAWFNADALLAGQSPEALARRRTGLSPQTVFRGTAPGDSVGPYLSQLLLLGSPSAAGGPHGGIIEYGAQTIDQRVRLAARNDFMTTWDEWFDVVNGLSPSTGRADTGVRRFITTGRDLATYVHTDALYQAYLNASLVMLSNGIRLDPSLPYQQLDAVDHQQGFVLYAMQQVLSLLGEVCDRALKTVLFQKFNVHRRPRPEELAARVEKSDIIRIPMVSRMAHQLNDSVIADEIRRRSRQVTGTESMLLPQAFPEGSPMHPSYGAGHATVAGACVTILKTLFDHTRQFDLAGDPFRAYVPTSDGSQLALVDVHDANGNAAALTVEGELNKLAANIAIGRNWAGVHYFTDYWESLLLGEQVAIQVLREHVLTMHEPPNLLVPRFDGTAVWV